MEGNKMNASDEFKKECQDRIEGYSSNKSLKEVSVSFTNATINAKYSYNFTWLGRPIIQYPQDIIAMQEIIWRVKPDLIIETGIAHGVLSYFMPPCLNFWRDGHVVGIDIDIRKHNRVEIEKHPMFKRITMIEGSSTDEK